MIIDLTLFSLFCIGLAGLFVGLITIIGNRYERANARTRSVIKITETTFRKNTSDEEKSCY